jgi:enediyne biosynthesis protein E4
VASGLVGIVVVPTSASGMLGQQAGAPAAAMHFTNVNASAGIAVTGLGNAAGWIDYDDDGDQDLIASNSSIPTDRVWLYRNDGDGTFTDVTQAAGLGSASIRSLAAGDYDDDGWPDIAATGYGINERTKLFRNQGDGTFVDVGASAGMRVGSTAWRVSWIDYDRDGWLDLFQTNGGADFLYHNLGNGTFAEVARTAGVADPAFGNTGAWADEDGDGWPDLFVANDGPDHLYHNDGDGTFTDITLQAGVSDGAESQAACWGDYDADADPDLYVVDIDASSNHLYRNDGGGLFTDVTQTAHVGDVGDGRTCGWVDPDGDGRLDLFATDHIHVNRLYRNRGDGTFSDVAAQSGISNPIDVFDGPWGDFDGDVKLDVMVVGHFDNVLYRNDTPTGSFVQLTLVGVSSNRSAIGATAVMKLGPRRQLLAVQGSSGAYGQESLPLEFGVGSAPGPFSIRITWPSGLVETVQAVPGDAIVVTEPAG